MEKGHWGEIRFFIDRKGEWKTNAMMLLLEITNRKSFGKR
jgi:hypothetical protein